MVQDWVATSAAEMQAARLMTLHAAWTMDQVGASNARDRDRDDQVLGRAGAARRDRPRHPGARFARASPATCRWSRCTGPPGPPASTTAPTRCTRPPWPAGSCAGTRPVDGPDRARSHPRGRGAGAVRRTAGPRDREPVRSADRRERRPRNDGPGAISSPGRPRARADFRAAASAARSCSRDRISSGVYAAPAPFRPHRDRTGRRHAGEPGQSEQLPPPHPVNRTGRAGQRDHPRPGVRAGPDR